MMMCDECSFLRFWILSLIFDGDGKGGRSGARRRLDIWGVAVGVGVETCWERAHR